MHDQTFLTPQQASRTDEYLRTLAQRYDHAGVRLQAFFGRCCLATADCYTGPGGVDAARVHDDLAAYAHAIATDPNAGQLGLDPLLVAEADCMLRAAGLQTPALAIMTERIARELAAQPSQVSSMGRVRLVAARLRALGHNVKMAAPSSQAAGLMKRPPSWLSAPTAELTDMVDHLTADCTPLDAAQSHILSLIALAELRNYRVDIGCKVLRLVLQQGAIAEETVEALN